MREELLEYWSILCGDDYPDFISKYLNVKELKRLKGIGQFCGCDYCKIYDIRYWYSRFDHSISVALITWKFTKDKKQTLAALFHDLGTPVFSHTIDYLLKDYINQETSEMSVRDIILNSNDIMALLKEDNIDVEDIVDVKKYSIIENKSPKLCADRLDGVLHTVYIWLNVYTLQQIREIYENITVLLDEDKKDELGFKSVKSGELFFEAVYEYSMVLQSCEDKFIMQYIADILEKTIRNNKITLNDLYIKEEAEIIKVLNNEESWNVFKNSNKVIRTQIKPKNYFVSVEAKKRVVVPLCLKKESIVRLDKASKSVTKLLETYNQFKDSPYCYMEKIDKV